MIQLPYLSSRHMSEEHTGYTSPNGTQVMGTPDKMILRTENLVKKYRQRTVVNHVSIDVTQGEIVGLLGKSEAKS